MEMLIRPSSIFVPCRERTDAVTRPLSGWIFKRSCYIYLTNVEKPIVSVLFCKWGNIASGVGDKSGVKSDVFHIILHNYKEATKGFNSQITLWYIWSKLLYSKVQYKHHAYNIVCLIYDAFAFVTEQEEMINVLGIFSIRCLIQINFIFKHSIPKLLQYVFKTLQTKE
jgi:hypothetical protein